MTVRTIIVVAVLWWVPAALAGNTDADRDILVTFHNDGAVVGRAAASAPYRFRKRYAIGREALRHSRDIAAEHGLASVDHWPIRVLSVYCVVFRVPDGHDRDAVIAALRQDARVESAQRLQEFRLRSIRSAVYNDPYAGVQHGLDTLAITAAHRRTRGEGVRVAIIDSNADLAHEDLAGRIRRVEEFVADGERRDREHGTAVASVIGARSNNARGIVGVAPAATLDVLVSCWHGDSDVVCDSFSLLKALDFLLADPPDILNLSLAGPDDRLVARLLEKALAAGVVIVASSPSSQAAFPASMHGVIGIGRSEAGDASGLVAPGEQILVATPGNRYDFRSGSSLSAAHVSGVVALLLSAAPGQSTDRLRDVLTRSQSGVESRSVNACTALQIADDRFECTD